LFYLLFANALAIRIDVLRIVIPGHSDRALGLQERKSPYLGHTGVCHRSRRRFAGIICCVRPASLAASLGRRSYSIYLIHGFVLPAFGPLFARVVSTGVSTEALTIILCLSVSSIVGSVFSP
jgi:hypothetical protein